MRLDKWLAHCTGWSRKQVKSLLDDERVRVNDVIVSDSGLHIGAQDRVTLDEKTLNLPGNRYIMLNKPAGYVCTRDDSHHPNVFQLVTNSQDLHAAGRLDADTTGLVLLTNDGQWSHRITSPKKQCGKIYRVTLAEPLSSQQEKDLIQGLILNGETKATRPAQIEHLSEMLVRLTIHEGKYHQVKRMFAAVDNQVIALHREQIGGIVLDQQLAPGAWRELTPAEQSSLDV
jgi:16S rRNA pseudouridine516 synthase